MYPFSRANRRKDSATACIDSGLKGSSKCLELIFGRIERNTTAIDTPTKASTMASPHPGFKESAKKCGADFATTRRTANVVSKKFRVSSQSKTACFGEHKLEFIYGYNFGC